MGACIGIYHAWKLNCDYEYMQLHVVRDSLDFVRATQQLFQSQPHKKISTP